VARHYKWALCVKAMHLLAAVQGWAYVLLEVPKEAVYDETFKVLEDCFGDQHLAAAYHSELKTRIQLIGVSAKSCHHNQTVGPLRLSCTTNTAAPGR
jgi:hypothetical protein